MKRLVLLLFVAWGAMGAEIAVTFDDLPAVQAGEPIAVLRRLTRSLLAQLTARKIPAVGLVNTSKLVTEAHAGLLDRWMEAGFELGNHTYSHSDLHHVGAEAFEEDVVKGETPLREVIRKHRSRTSRERRSGCRSWRRSRSRREIEAELSRVRPENST
jgi:peptidoglycan/xylan/chitin deacetylase (PgdA/CDA1 family)